MLISLRYDNWLQEARRRQSAGLDPLEFEAAMRLRNTPHTREYFPGESHILTHDMLEQSSSRCVRVRSGMWMSYDFLMGSHYELPRELLPVKRKILREVDEQIEGRQRRDGMADVWGIKVQCYMYHWCVWSVLSSSVTELEYPVLWFSLYPCPLLCLILLSSRFWVSALRHSDRDPFCCQIIKISSKTNALSLVSHVLFDCFGPYCDLLECHF